MPSTHTACQRCPVSSSVKMHFPPPQPPLCSTPSTHTAPPARGQRRPAATPRAPSGLSSCSPPPTSGWRQVRCPLHSHRHGQRPGYALGPPLPQAPAWHRHSCLNIHPFSGGPFHPTSGSSLPGHRGPREPRPGPAPAPPPARDEGAQSLVCRQRQTDLVQDSENKAPFKLQSPGG